MYNDIITNYVNSLKDIFALQISYFNLYNKYYSIILYLSGLLSESQKDIDINHFMKDGFNKWIKSCRKV